MYELKGKTALITGGGKRIGRAIALSLAERGANLIVHYNHSEEAAMEVATKALNLGVHATTCRADLEDPEQIKEFFETCRQQAPSIEILINSASIFPSNTLEDMTLNELEQNLRINAITPLFLARLFAAAAEEGCIINFLDSRITDYDKRHAAYHASKRLFFSLTRMMSLDFAPNIRVNAVAPGLVLPPAGKDVSFLEELAYTNPLNKYGFAEDIVRATLFLLESDFITGQVIYVDGGRHIRGNVYGS